MAKKDTKRRKDSKQGKDMTQSREPKDTTEMNESQDTAPQASATQAATQSVNFQLLPANGSDQPVLANVTIVQATSGVAYLDFGFLDPGAMNALTSMARAGQKVPERINGRLAARVALTYEALVALHQQLGNVIQAIARQGKS